MIMMVIDDSQHLLTCFQRMAQIPDTVLRIVNFGPSTTADAGKRSRVCVSPRDKDIVKDKSSKNNNK
jgi:hypothetical protein